MSNPIEFKMPEDWIQIFVPDLIHRWCFDKPLELIRKEEREGLSKASFVFDPYNKRTWMTHSTGFLLPNKFPEYGNITVEVDNTYYAGDAPRREDMNELLRYLGQFSADYSLKRVSMRANVGKKVFNDPPWITKLIADKRRVSLESIGWYEADENARERTENYAAELQRRGLELLCKEELVL